MVKDHYKIKQKKSKYKIEKIKEKNRLRVTINNKSRMIKQETNKTKSNIKYKKAKNLNNRSIK